MQRNVGARQLVSIDFCDGYLFKFLQDLAADADEKDTGLYRYYTARVEGRLGGLLDYEGALGRYLLSEFPRETRFVHIGIGIGTTTALLASLGRRVTGIEADARRMATAKRLRSSLCAMWPDIEPRYDLIEGYFPDVLDTAKISSGPDTVAFFTNFVGNSLVRRRPDHGYVPCVRSRGRRDADVCEDARTARGT